MDKGQGSRNKIKEVKQFKGLVTTVDSGELQIDVLEKAENVVFDIEGGARKREGFKKFTDKKLPKKSLTLKSANEIKLSPFKTEVAGYGLIKTTLTDDYLTNFKDDYTLTALLNDAQTNNTGASTIVSQIETNGVADLTNIKSNDILINYTQDVNTVNNDRLKIKDTKVINSGIFNQTFSLKNKIRDEVNFLRRNDIYTFDYDYEDTNVNGLKRLNSFNINENGTTILTVIFPDHSFGSNQNDHAKDVAVRYEDILNNRIISNLKVVRIDHLDNYSISFDAFLFTKVLWPANENSIDQSVATSLMPVFKSVGTSTRDFYGHHFFSFCKVVGNGESVTIDDIRADHDDGSKRILSTNSDGLDEHTRKISHFWNGTTKRLIRESISGSLHFLNYDENILFVKKDDIKVYSKDVNREHNTFIDNTGTNIKIYDVLEKIPASRPSEYYGEYSLQYNTSCRTDQYGSVVCNFSTVTYRYNRPELNAYSVDVYTMPDNRLMDSHKRTIYEVTSTWTNDSGVDKINNQEYINNLDFYDEHSELGVYKDWSLKIKSLEDTDSWLVNFNMNKEIASSDEELIKTMAAYQRSAGKNYIDKKIKYDVFTYSSEYFGNDNIHISIYGNGLFLRNINISGGSKSFDTGISSSLVDEVECVELDDKIIITTGVKVFVVSILQNTNSIDVVEDCFIVSEINDLAETVGFIESSISGTNALGTNYNIDEANEVYGYAGVKILGVTVYNNTEKIDYSDLNSHDEFVFIPIVAHKDQEDDLTYQWKISIVDYVTKEVTELTSVNGVNTSIDLDNPTLKPGMIFTDSTTYIFSLKVTSNDGTNTYEDSFTFNMLNNVLVDNKVVNTVDSRDTIDQINKCKFVTKLNNKILLYGNGTRNIYTSETNRPLYFPMNNIVYADSYGRKENILKISTYKDIGIIFTETSMMSLSGGGSILLNDPWRVLPLSGNHGTVAHNSTIEADNTIVFVYRDGIYLIEQLSVSEKRVSLINISFPINDLVLPYKDVVDKTNEELYKGIHAFNLEGRLYFSYPENNYMLVYDYSLNGMDKGLWTVWKSNALNFWKLFKINNDEQMCVIDYDNRDSIWVKRPKVNTTIDSIDFPTDFYKDGNKDIKFLIKTINSNMDMTWDAMKVKRLNIRTRNNKVDSGTYDVRITDNGIPIQSYTVDGVAYDNPTLGQMKLGKTLTTYRPSDNISQKVFLTSKSAREMSIEIENQSSLPFEVTGLFIEYCESKIKPTKLR